MSTAKANFPPNGADFPTGATGRFSNGRNMADYIAYLSLVAGNPGPISESDLQTVLSNGGLNFASGGGGPSDFGRRNYGQVRAV
ncbi:GDSL esterase/lipase At2g19060 [Linum grandiflorum]